MKTLYIIGNGFDLAHGLPTRYADFHEWLWESIYYYATEFVSSIENFISGIYLWRDFERALGSINVREYIQYIVKEDVLRNPEDDYIMQIEDVYDSIEYFFKDYYSFLIEAFQFWVHTIPVKSILPVFSELYYEDYFFFTFNYTNTLEYIYNIPQYRVLHIHGNTITNPKDIIVGHNYDYQQDRCIIKNYLNEIDMTDNEEVVDKMIEMLNLSFKNTKEIMHHYCQYFITLRRLDINKIIVWGHSYGEIDWPYFEMIKNMCCNAQWELTYYNEEDLNGASIMNKYLSLSAIFSPIQNRKRDIIL